MVHEQDLHTRKNADIIPYLLLISIQVKLRPSNRVHVRKTQIHRQLITKCINRLLWYLYNGHLVSHSTPKKKLASFSESQKRNDEVYCVFDTEKEGDSDPTVTIKMPNGKEKGQIVTNKRYTAHMNEIKKKPSSLVILS